jgi:hypothetical protein
MTNPDMFVNKNDCLDDTPGFINYIPEGIPTQNIDLESDLKNITRDNSRCSSCKWQPQVPEQIKDTLPTNIKGTFPNNKNVCKSSQKVLPVGYIIQDVMFDPITQQLRGFKKAN